MKLAPMLLLAAPAMAAGPSAELIEPRAFGYSVGDVLQRRVLLDLPAGLAPDLSSLPQARRPGQAIELRAVRLQGRALLLDYQVFLAPPEVRTLEIPPMRLRLAGPAGEQFLRIEAWPVTVAPLVPLDVSPREGLGELRPDVAPPAIDIRPRQWRLAGAAVLLALAAAYLLQVYVGLPWWGRRQRPFAVAWRSLRRAPDTASAEQWRAAMRLLHQALNRSAGEVLFEAGLPGFIAAQPRYAPLHTGLVDFFRRSQALFFGGDETAGDLRWLRDLARDCRDAERGSA